MSSLVGSAVCPCPDAQAGALKGSASCAAAGSAASVVTNRVTINR
jgi:hypothetical protein